MQRERSHRFRWRRDRAEPGRADRVKAVTAPGFVTAVQDGGASSEVSGHSAAAF